MATRVLMRSSSTRLLARIMSSIRRATGCRLSRILGTMSAKNITCPVLLRPHRCDGRCEPRRQPDPSPGQDRRADPIPHQADESKRSGNSKNVIAPSKDLEKRIERLEDNHPGKSTKRAKYATMLMRSRCLLFSGKEGNLRGYDEDIHCRSGEPAACRFPYGPGRSEKDRDYSHKAFSISSFIIICESSI